MLSLAQAQAKLIAMVSKTPIENVNVDGALGRCLADNVHARRTQPPADLSAMDGYAIAGDGPWRRVGESRAGAPYPSPLQTGECVRISTGAHMPTGSDRVLIQENAEVDGTSICSETIPPANRHVRVRGFDFVGGDKLLEAGTKIGPAQVALVLSAGHASIPVYRPPSVAILDSGDELCADPTLCGADQIPASNGAMIASMLAPFGCPISRLGPVPDDRDKLAHALAASETSDILITSGGASVGDHDLIQQSLRDWGAELTFWKVAIKPGKPLMVARRGEQIILGLPGNPVSSFVTSFLFALPLIRASMGDRNPLPNALRLNAGEDFETGGTREEFLRGFHDGVQVRRAGSQDSSALHALSASNCLIRRPAGAGAVAFGEPISIFAT
ncbi:MAG: molybdopterin molybdotransferase MoeA [Erythrobacter sp.]